MSPVACLPAQLILGCRCNFSLGGRQVNNWDSPLTPTGQEQAANASRWLSSEASSGVTWSQLLGLKAAPRFTSPLTRTLETARAALGSHANLTASSLLRASLGRDVCNAQHRVAGPYVPAVAPWDTGCSAAKSAQSLVSLYPREFVSLRARPAGSASPGLVGETDQLWQSAIKEVSLFSKRSEHLS